MPNGPQGLEDQLCFSVYSTALAINRLYKPALDELGLTYPQYLALIALWETDGLSVKEIADRLMLESSTVTPLLKRLESGGLVQRRRNPDDERQVFITLTDEGRTMKTRATCVPASLLAASGASIAELKRLNGELKALRDALTERAPQAD